MITKIVETIYYTNEEEVEAHKERIDNVVNAEVLAAGKFREGYFITVSIKYKENNENE